MAYPIVRLIKGGLSFSLTDATYSVVDFTPVSVREIAFYSGGSSANRRGGSQKIGMTSANQTLTFGVRIIGSSVADVRLKARRLQIVLDLAGEQGQPPLLA